MYRARVKKYGKDGMQKIPSARAKVPVQKRLVKSKTSIIKRKRILPSLEESIGKEITEEEFEKLAEKKDVLSPKVKARYKVWPSAYVRWFSSVVQKRRG